jgi:hypothetical protein
VRKLVRWLWKRRWVCLPVCFDGVVFEGCNKNTLDRLDGIVSMARRFGWVDGVI